MKRRDTATEVVDRVMDRFMGRLKWERQMMCQRAKTYRIYRFFRDESRRFVACSHSEENAITTAMMHVLFAHDSETEDVARVVLVTPDGQIRHWDLPRKSLQPVREEAEAYLRSLPREELARRRQEAFQQDTGGV